MIVNVLLLAVFAGALHFERKNLNVLGLTPVGKRFSQLLIGFLLTAALCAGSNFAFAWQTNFQWQFNTNFNSKQFPSVVYNTFNSVMFEELIFRSYLLYKLVQLLDERKGVLISSAAFGIYHWFTFGVFGNPVAMAWVFFYTGLWGVMFAYSYTRTGSIFLAIGLHWGWNFFDQVIFNGSGEGLMQPINLDHSTRTVISITSILTIVFAVVTIIYFIKTHRVSVSRVP